MNHDEPLLAAREITLRRGDGTNGKRILENSSLALRCRETVILRGQSGAGKSSLLWALARLLPLESGTLLLEGKPSNDWAPPIWRERVALVLQKHALLPGTVRDNLLLPWTLNVRRAASSSAPDEGRLGQELRDLALDDVDLADDASRLSVGQTGRISLARTLLTDPSCLLLDEPLAALDPESAARVLERIHAFAAAGGAVLLTRHDGLAAEEGRVLTIADRTIKERKP